jgi:RTX calcium-binding nonapeptide repeat (4 copies)
MLGFARCESRWRALVASVATLTSVVALSATAATHAGTRAGVTCRFDIATHRLTVTFHNDDANGGVVRDGENLVVEDVFGPLGCAGANDPTRFNTENVRVRSRAQSVGDLEFVLDLRGGPLTPGFGDEGDGSSEIEFVVSFPTRSDSRVPIHGSREPDRIVLGDLAHRKGANLNAGEDVGDPDVTIRGGMPLVYGSGGADVISARGGDGFVGPYPALVVEFGGRGDDLLMGGFWHQALFGMRGGDFLKAGRKADLLKGGQGRDGLKGGQGHDAMSAGRGVDFVHARDNTRDEVRCGRGSDNGAADRIDRLRGCEDVLTNASG